jgi:2-keto-3-deoxy-L-arabinonate dehydratase
VNFPLQGIVPIVPTPFHASEEIDWDSFSGLVDFAVAAGASAICLPAYASEFYKLSEEERLALISAAVKCSAGRIPVIGQVNSPSLKLAIESARRAAAAGASAICTAVPRLFATTENDLFHYFDRLLAAISLPYILQDFNPGGPSVSPGWIARLHRAHPHFCYIKLEEPMLSAKIAAIRELTGGGVGVLEGWGGMYTLDLAPCGVSGVVPGLALADLLGLVFRHARDGRRDEAYPAFQAILPQIVYSLQNMELFHHAEKRLLAARGILPSITVRSHAMTLTTHDEQYIEFLNSRILKLLDRLGLPYDPRCIKKK